MTDDRQEKGTGDNVLSQEQERILDMYVESLDDFYLRIKKAEKIQAEIETLHLKRILTK